MDFTYTAFGLLLRSNVPLSGVPPADLSPDSSPPAVRLHLRATPYLDAARSPRERNSLYVSSYTDETGEPTLRIWNAADQSFLRLDYRDGTQFWIDRARQNLFALWPEHLTLQNALTYLLGPVFGLLLRLRGVTCLHASAVAFDDCCAVFVGSEGAGKSTTAAAFAKQGHAVLSDDIVALCGGGPSEPCFSSPVSSDPPSHPPDSRFFVLPAYPHICLWPEAAEFLYGSQEQLPPLAPDWEKRKLALGSAGTRFASRALPIAAIYLFAARASENAPRLESAPRKSALLSLLANTYANNLLDPAMRAEEFAVLDRLVAAVPVRLLTAHTDPSRIAQLCTIVYSDIRSLSRAEP